MSGKIPEIYDNYHRPNTEHEKGGGKSTVEPGGSLPVRIQIEQMLTAGRRLKEQRASMFDFNEGEEVDENAPVDPTRNPNFDLADATQAARVAIGNIQATAKNAAAKARADKLQAKAQAAESEVKE